MSAHPPRPSQLTPWHMAGIFAIYIRQSTIEQVRKRVGSGMAQRNLGKLVLSWGVPRSRIRFYDDMGQSGTTTRKRPGYQALVQDITTGEVRVVIVAEISRLGRDDIEVARFLLLCEVKGVLLIENGVVRDPRQEGDWTLLRIQGLLSAQENKRKAARMRSAMQAKVEAGIAFWRLPAAFDRGPDGEVVQAADPAVREVTLRAWRELLENQTPGDVARTLRREKKMYAVRRASGAVEWVVPRRIHIVRLARSPLYAGFVVPKTQAERDLDGRRHRRAAPKAPETWKRSEKVKAYVTPDEFWRVQQLLAARRPAEIAPLRDGRALCAQLLYCRRCKVRMHARYESEPAGSGRRVRRHYYTCQGSWEDMGVTPPCQTVSGRLLDQAVEEILWAELHCPSPAALLEALREENRRRQADGRLLAAELQRAEAAVAQTRALLEESRARNRNPLVIQFYEDEMGRALQQQKDVERTVATTPAPQLLDASPDFAARLASFFSKLPSLWHSGRLGPRERREVVRRVVRRIEVGPLVKGATTQAAVTLYTGVVVERVLYGPAGRRQLVESLAVEGRSPEDIVAECARRGIRDHHGGPLELADVKKFLRYRRGRGLEERRAMRRAADAALRALWAQALPAGEIAERLNAQGHLTGTYRPWTAGRVYHRARQLGLPPRWEIHRALLRPILAEWVAAGMSDEAIAAELNRRGIPTYSRRPWTAAHVMEFRLDLGIRRSPSSRPHGGDSREPAATQGTRTSGKEESDARPSQKQPGGQGLSDAT